MIQKNILQTRSISKSFPGVQALKDIDFNLKPGEVHALIGENGAGKSTFVKIISGNIMADKGEILYKGQEYRVKNTREARRKGISMAYQELSLVPELTVTENILLGEYIYKNRNKIISIIDWEETFNKAREIMKRYNLKIDVRKKINQLGVGEQQLVEIIRAVAKKINILLLDEPTSALSRDEINILFNNIIKNMKERGIAVIYISHRLEEAFAIADRVTVFRDGKKVKTLPIESTDEEELIQLMVGREIENRYVKEKSVIGNCYLRVKDLSAEGFIDDCNLFIRRGEIVGLAGLMGAGRTEFAKTLVGLNPGDGGHIYINDNEVEIEKPEDALEAGIAYLAEDRNESLVHQLSVAANITLASLKSIFNMGILDKKKERRAGERFIKKFNIDTPGITRKVKYLSGGNQQKVALARWIYSNVDIFILDEPTRGIDVGAKIEVYNLMNNLLRQNKAILLISSELPEIVSLCDRVYVMYKGKIIAEYRGTEITQENIMKSATGRGKSNES